jgi:hypothetical protein
MILASHGIIASQIASFDADAAAFFNRVTTAGGTLSTTEKQAVNQLVLDLKANSLWTPMKAIYPMVGASAAACAQNLKSASFTGVFNGGWTFASTGATPNGTTGFMTTGFIPSAQLSSQDSTHLSTYIRTTTTGNQIFIGGTNGVSNCYVLNFGIMAVNSGDAGGVINTSGTNGFFLNTRTNSANMDQYKNNTLLINRSSPSNGFTSQQIYVGGYNNAGVLLLPSNNQTAFASLGEGLTGTQESNFYTAVQAFQTTLSRQV